MIKLGQKRRFLVLNLRQFNYEAGVLVGSKADATTCKVKCLVKLNHHILENKHISMRSRETGIIILGDKFNKLHLELIS